jgi:hypothetical protein
VTDARELLVDANFSFAAAGYNLVQWRNLVAHAVY